MKAILQILKYVPYTELILFGLAINFGIYLGSLGLYALLGRISRAQRLGEQHPLRGEDVVLSLVTVLCNTIVFVLGVLLWKSGFIQLAENLQWWQVLAEVFFLTMVMDLLMYVFHRAVHFWQYFRRVHARHHEHESTNMLSLFVLHPMESIGFGLMMLAVISVFPFSAIGISIYLVINSLWGTVGHLNHSMLPDSWLRLARKAHVCTSEFHYLHHQHPDYNFGFYSSVWDAVFRTLHPALRK